MKLPRGKDLPKCQYKIEQWIVSTIVYALHIQNTICLTIVIYKKKIINTNLPTVISPRNYLFPTILPSTNFLFWVKNEWSIECNFGNKETVYMCFQLDLLCSSRCNIISVLLPNHTSSTNLRCSRMCSQWIKSWTKLKLGLFGIFICDFSLLLFYFVYSLLV